MELRRGFPMMAPVSFNVPEYGTQLIVPGVVALDPWLAPFKESLKARYNKAQDWIKKIDETEGGLEKFSRVRPHHATQFPSLTRAGNREVWIQRGQGKQYYL
jgi:hypothetical protein